MMPVDYLKPKGMHQNPAFTQALILPAGARLLLIGGQNSVDKDGMLVDGDLGEQTAKALENLKLCLDAAGAGIDDIVKVTIYIAGDLDIMPGFEAWMKFAGQPTNPPIVTVLKVLALGRPGVLVEIEATAVLPG
jgi:enamine deaminase RidA (YjgF/YER057c/UK114 family)